MPRVKKLKSKPTTKKVVRTKGRKSVPQVSLPMKLSIPPTNIGAYSFLIYGPKKIGKTSMLAKMGVHVGDKKVLFLMFEPGGKALKIYQKPVTSWNEFRQYVKLLIKSKEFGAVVVDTGDIAYDRCLEYTCDKLGVDHPSDSEWGKGWNAVKKEFTTEIDKLLHAGMGVFFTSHSKKDEIKSRSGDSFHETGPTMSKQARDVLEGVIDVWILYDYVGDERYLRLIGNEDIGAGHRLEERFRYTNGSPIVKIHAGKSPIETCNNLVKGFNNELFKPKKKEGGVKIKRNSKKLLRRKK